jgi:hypothetical protein
VADEEKMTLHIYTNSGQLWRGERFQVKKIWYRPQATYLSALC